MKMQMQMLQEKPSFLTTDILEKWLQANQQLINQHTAEHFPTLTPDVLSYTEGGKFYKIIRKTGNHSGGSVQYAFVAKLDFENKALGQVKMGDILKPASWLQPARHARGNLLDEFAGMKFMGVYGPAYLK